MSGYTPTPHLPNGDPFWSMPGDSPLVQILMGHDAWRRSTKKQREILIGQRVEINDRKKSPLERYAVRAKVDVPPRTLASMQAKGLVDERGVLTLSGAYGVIWGPGLEERKKPAPQPLVNAGMKQAIMDAAVKDGLL